MTDIIATVEADVEKIVHEAEQKLENLLHPAKTQVTPPVPTTTPAPTTTSAPAPVTASTGAAPEAAPAAGPVTNPAPAVATEPTLIVAAIQTGLRDAADFIESGAQRLEDLLHFPGKPSTVVTDIKAGLALIRKYV